MRVRLSIQGYHMVGGEDLTRSEFNIVLAGVGGQGILLIGEVLGNAAVAERLNVRVSEIHGMAQRGGAVECHVRLGEGVYAPTVSEGTADLLVGLEPLEALRHIKYASKKTRIVVNTRTLPPPQSSAKTGAAAYPSLESIISKIRLFTENVRMVDAQTLARKAGSMITENIVMLGAAAATQNFPLSVEALRKAVGEAVPAKYVDVNLKAFELGYAAAQKP